MNRKVLIFGTVCVWAASLMFSGCSQKEAPAENSPAAEEVSETPAAETSAPLVNVPGDGQEDTDQMGEGTVPEDIPEESDLKKAGLGDTLKFTRDGQELYSVVLEKAELTNRRAVAETEAPEKVLLITYRYQSLSGDSVLVDDMSFRCFDSSGDSCTPYYLADQIIAEVNNGEGMTEAEAAFSVPGDMQEAQIYVVNNSNPEGEAYQVTVQP